MNELKYRFMNTKGIDECQRVLSTGLIEKEAFYFLRELHLDSIIRTRNFLTAFLIHYYGDVVLSKTPKDIALRTSADDIFRIDPDNFSELSEAVFQFIVAFEMWKSGSVDQIKHDLLNHYHSLVIESISIKDKNLKSIYQKTFQNILKYAKKIHFDSELRGYLHTIVNKYNIKNNEDGQLCKEIDYSLRHETHHDFFLGIFSFFQEFLLLLIDKNQKEEFLQILNVEHIKTQYKQQLYTNQDFITLFDYLYHVLLPFQHSGRHDTWKHYRSKLNAKPLDIAEQLVCLTELIFLFVQDVEKI